MARQFTVAIVGAGPVGLSAAVLCQRYGLDCVILEKHPDTSIHPKARGISIRTMELMRQWGVESDVRSAGVSAETRSGVTFCKTLSDPSYRYIQIEDDETSRRVSPTTGCGCSQERLEEVLKRAIQNSRGIDLRFNHTLTNLRPQPLSVALDVVDTEGNTSEIDARYVIAADGARSTVRSLIGAEMIGPSGLSYNMNILFDTDLGHLLMSHPSRLYWIDNAPALTGVLAPVIWPRRWLLNVVYDPTKIQAGDFDKSRCLTLIHAAIGDSPVDVELVHSAGWVADAQVSSAWRRDRIFLAGDAAHLMPPYGGFGANTGVQDVHNLVWKIAADWKGWAGPELLNSYESERLPVARGTIETAVARMRALESAKPNLDSSVISGRKPERYDGVGMGYRYHSAVVCGAHDGPVIPENIQDFVPDGQPGKRAPHVALEEEGSSILDHFESGFTLLALGNGDWSLAAQAIARSGMGPPCQFIPLAGKVAAEFAEAYRIGAAGIVLVRPDGFVAWRSDTADGDRLPILADAILKAAGHI